MLTLSDSEDVYDVESYHAVGGHTICPGPTGYIWDYSAPADGSQSYQPHMYGNDGDFNDGTGVGIISYWSDANWGWPHYQ
jgi:hypothetical protein